MTLEEIEKQWLVDSDLQKQDLADLSLRIPRLHHKYYGFMNAEAKLKTKIQFGIEQTEHVLKMFYQRKLTQEEIDEYDLGELPDRKILREDLDDTVANHKDVIDAKKRLALQLAKLDYLKSILAQISQMSFNIRNAIEYQKFQAGG